MGFTLPYGGVTAQYTALANSAHIKWLRCGFPEIQSTLSSPSNVANAGTFSTTQIAAEVAAAHAAGLGYVFSMLGVPAQVNSHAGVVSGTNPGGSWKLFPTSAAGRTQMAGYAGQIATVLMNSFRSTGFPVMFEAWQEANIPSFNPEAQDYTVVAPALAEVHLAVRAAEPLCPIMGASLANRGDWSNPVPSDVGWTGPGFMTGMLVADTRLKTTAAPDYWGYHPYWGVEDPSNLTIPWATGQFIAFHNALVSSNAQSPSGGPALVAVTEFGPYRDYTFDVQSQSGNIINAASARFVASSVGSLIYGPNIPANTIVLQKNSSSQVVLSNTPTGTVTYATITDETRQREQMISGLATFNKFRDAGWLSGPEFKYQEFGEQYSIYAAASPHTPNPAGEYYNNPPDYPAPNPPPTAAFTVSPSAGTAPLVSQFTDKSTNAPTNWVWDFGDGGTSTNKSPSHTFTVVGTYTVTLTASNTFGSTSTTRTITVSSVVVNPPGTGVVLGDGYELGDPNVTLGGDLLTSNATVSSNPFATVRVSPPNFTAGDILDLKTNVGQVRASVEWEVLDAKLQYLFTIHPDKKSTPSVAVDSTSTIKRTCSGLHLDPTDAAKIDVLTMRVRPYWTFAGHTDRFPLGVFLFSDANRKRMSSGTTLQGTLYDQTVMIDQGLGSTYGLPTNYPVMEALLELAAQVGISGPGINLEPCDNLTNGAIAWRAGTSRYEIMTQLATMCGYYPPFFDNNGQLRFKRSPSSLLLVEPDHRYNLDPSRLIKDTLVESNDLINAPNRYLVVSTAATDQEISAYYDIPASAPHSFANRGYLVVKRIDVQGLTTTGEARKRAQLEAITDFNSFEQAAFDATPDPRHDIFDTVEYLYQTYRETGWSLKCSPGGAHSHSLRKLYD